MLLLNPFAHSTITVTPVSPNSASSDIFYYAATGAASGFVASGYHAFDLSTGLSSTQSTSDMILLDIKSTTNFTVGSGQALILKIMANESNTDDPHAIPIAAAGITTGVPADCSGSNIYCNVLGPNSKYWMVSYPEQQTIRIGVYPRDICFYADWVENNGGSGSGFAQGCEDNITVISGAETSAALPITADIYVADTTAALIDVATVYAAATGGSEETSEKTLNFQKAPPTYTCPSSMNTIYFPGDGGINLSGSQFSATRATGGAPVNSILVVANKGSAALTGSGTYLSNSLVRTAPIGVESFVSGFDNTTTGTDNYYNLAFSVQDLSGYVADFTAGCTAQNVQASEIQTFLKTNRCFIASSAFRNPQAIPVLILRDFRDQILMKTYLGKHFVSWYYQHSPVAAQWLWFHPEFRFAVITALSPLIITAVILLHPEILFILLVGGALLYWIRRHRVRTSASI